MKSPNWMQSKRLLSICSNHKRLVIFLYWVPVIMRWIDSASFPLDSLGLSWNSQLFSDVSFQLFSQLLFSVILLLQGCFVLWRPIRYSLLYHFIRKVNKYWHSFTGDWIQNCTISFFLFLFLLVAYYWTLFLSDW